MNVRILNDSVKVYSIIDKSIEATSELHLNDVVEIGATIKKKGIKYVEIKTPEGLEGLIPGDTDTLIADATSPEQKQIKVYKSPDASSEIVTVFKKKNKFYMLEKVDVGKKQWVKVADPDGLEGYIDGNSRIKIEPLPLTPAQKLGKAKRDIVFGLLWCIGGIVVTAATYSAVQESGGTYVVAWGAVLFGGIQFLKGLFYYIASLGKQ